MSGGSTDANEKWRVSSHGDPCRTTSSWEKNSFFLRLLVLSRQNRSSQQYLISMSSVLLGQMAFSILCIPVVLAFCWNKLSGMGCRSCQREVAQRISLGKLTAIPGQVPVFLTRGCSMQLGAGSHNECVCGKENKRISILSCELSPEKGQGQYIWLCQALTRPRFLKLCKSLRDTGRKIPSRLQVHSFLIL